jgi:hypothetical protein
MKLEYTHRGPANEEPDPKIFAEPSSECTQAATKKETVSYIDEKKNK